MNIHCESSIRSENEFAIMNTEFIEKPTIAIAWNKKGLRQCAKLQYLGGRHYYFYYCCDCDCSGGKTKSYFVGFTKKPTL